MPGDFQYDVFLSHSAKDKAVVRPLAERLRQDGVKVWFDEWEIRPGDSIPAKIEEGLEHSRVLVFCMSANAFGSDWARLESGTFRFRDPLNKERRFLPLRLDAAPIKGSLAQFLYINWLPPEHDREYAKLVEACLSSKITMAVEDDKNKPLKMGRVYLPGGAWYSSVLTYVFSSDGRHAITGGNDKMVRRWDVEMGRCLHTFTGHSGAVFGVDWSTDQRRILSCSEDKTVRMWEMGTGNCVRVFTGHSGIVYRVRWGADPRLAISGSADRTVKLWDLETGKCLQTLKGHTAQVRDVVWSLDQSRVLSCSMDKTIRLWDLASGDCLQVFEGHTSYIWSLAWSSDQKHVLSGSRDKTVRLWDLNTGSCLRVFEGHLFDIFCVAWSPNQRYAYSGAAQLTARLWDIDTGRCLEVFGEDTAFTGGIVVLDRFNPYPPGTFRHIQWSADGRRAFAGDNKGVIHVWDVSAFMTEANAEASSVPRGPDQVQYTNAKILLVGDTHAGKTGLTHRLATNEWRPTDSTVGVWATQLKLHQSSAEPGVDREIWLWDFGGQADQRLVHQLYMDRTALILLLFNADQEDVLPGLRDWQTALRRCVKEKIPHFLVAGRIDTGFKASRGKLQAFAQEQGLAYHETSAKSGDGCNELRASLIADIPWAQMEKRTSPRIFKLIKDEILKLRNEGQVLHTFKELRELLWRRLPDEPRFTDETLQTVIGLLDGPGVVKELDYGTYILLAPEWINTYAQAVIRTLRNTENELGVLPLRSIAEGKLIYQSMGRDGVPVEMKRLPPAEERVVLGEMERQLEQRALCLRQGDKLVFPSHCGRDRPAVLEHPSVFVSYAVQGFLDDIYATLVVKLADCQAFRLKELWRDGADFVTLAEAHHMGIKLTRETASNGDISVYFGPGVTQQEQVIFANYIHAHLEGTSENAVRLRHYVCPHCHTAKGNPEALRKKLLREKHVADTECDDCGKRFPLWDALEKKFASDAVRKQVEELRSDDLANLSARRKGKMLVLDVGARITSANQKWIEVPGDEDDGIDMMIEFTDEDGNGVGKGLCLQLKAGNSHLTKRKDGKEVFTIKKERWVKTWTNQPYPVMLVIGTFPEEYERASAGSRLEFSDVRWMEITSVLKRESANGTKPVKQIVFTGERLDMSSVRRWREKVLASG